MMVIFLHLLLDLRISFKKAFNLKERKYFNPGSVKVKIDGMIFESIRSAAKNYNIAKEETSVHIHSTL